MYDTECDRRPALTLYNIGLNPLNILKNIWPTKTIPDKQKNVMETMVIAVIPETKKNPLTLGNIKKQLKLQNKLTSTNDHEE